MYFHAMCNDDDDERCKNIFDILWKIINLFSLSVVISKNSNKPFDEIVLHLSWFIQKHQQTISGLELFFTPGITWNIHIFPFFTWKYLELFSIFVRNFIIPNLKLLNFDFYI